MKCFQPKAVKLQSVCFTTLLGKVITLTALSYIHRVAQPANMLPKTSHFLYFFYYYVNCELCVDLFCALISWGSRLTRFTLHFIRVINISQWEQSLIYLNWCV